MTSLQQAFGVLGEVSNECGLVINLSKAKGILMQPCMAPQVPKPAVLKLPGGNSMEVVSTFKCIGSIVQRDCSLRSALHRRIGNAYFSFCRLQGLLCTRSGAGMTTKTLPHNANTLSALTHSALERCTYTLPAWAYLALERWAYTLCALTCLELERCGRWHPTLRPLSTPSTRLPQEDGWGAPWP
eukprot:364502-Chlamydomonas_euryale.AAC.5